MKMFGLQKLLLYKVESNLSLLEIKIETSNVIDYSHYFSWVSCLYSFICCIRGLKCDTHYTIMKKS